MTKTLLRDLINLFFPDACLACNRILERGEMALCTICLGGLPLPIHEISDNSALKERFWGHVIIQHASAFFPFTKAGTVQNIIHKIKYDNRQRAARILGRYYGATLKAAMQASLPWEQIVPVPLHPKRQIERGYNQSTCIAKGLTDVLNLPCRPQWLCRIVHTATQTSKEREERLLSIQKAFQVPSKMQAKVQGQHILLVDDLATTGATLTASAHALLQAGAKCISVAVLAIAT